jgi:eukaryotic-like serine/threonine-protein kinase
MPGAIAPDAQTAAMPGAIAPDAATGTAIGAIAPDAPTATGAGRGPRRPMSGTGPLSPGQDFGSRYHVIRLLGIGGMGAVYQAWDKILEVAVAIKVIRPPESMNEEDAQAAERRFKRELLLARKVTHKHVVRIHDLGELDGITYITMPYVQGSDLSTVMKREGRLPLDRALTIATQVASGLAAAHEAGIVHRDLKPANIMVDAEGDAMIMDFGIARSTTGGLTATAGGAVIGTIEYMAPEQARGVAVDQRADVYAFGLIVNDMLLGRRQSGSATAVAELMDRMQRPPAALRSIDPTIPEAIDALVTRCLQPDPDARYQRIDDVLAELDPRAAPGAAAVTRTGTRAPLVEPSVRLARPRSWWLAAAAALVVALGLGTWVFRDQLFTAAVEPPPAATGPAITLAILPFRNASNDSSLDAIGRGFSDVLRMELAQSTLVRTVSADRVHQVLQDLQLSPRSALTAPQLERVAEFTSARRVLWGQVTMFGDALRIDATLQNFDRSDPPVFLSANAASRTNDGLLAAVAELAEKVRADLGRGAPNILADLEASSWKPSTRSFEALRLYNDGLLLTQQGTHQEARTRFEAATKSDPDFALAYSALARSNASLGYSDEALRFSRQAMSLSAGLRAYEKHLIEANHYRLTNEDDKAFAAYLELVKASPNDAMLQFELGGLYEQNLDLAKAQPYYEKVVALDPKFVEGLLGLGRVKIRSGDYQGSLEHLNAAKTIAITLKRDEAHANILHAIGVAYRRLDRLDEALRNYEASLEIKQRLGLKRGTATSLAEIAQVHEAFGRGKEAEASYRAALAIQREIKDHIGTSATLVNLAGLLNETLGRPDEALTLLKEALQIRRDLGNANAEAMVLNNIGNVYLAKGDYSEAETYFERTLAIRQKTGVPELADTLHNLGETLTKRGRYDDALKRYFEALGIRRTAGDERGAAIESYGIGTVLDAQGSFGRAVKAKAEALQAFRALKQRDVWLAEILTGHGLSLALSGRVTESAASLDEATAVAQELKSPVHIGQVLRVRALRHLLAGEPALARPLADQSVEAATKGGDRGLLLVARSTSTLAAATVEPTRALARTFESLAIDADRLGLKALAVECAVSQARTLLALQDRAGARTRADRALAGAETMGFRLQQALALFVRAEALRASNDAGHVRDYREVRRILDEVKADEGNDQLLKRSDLAAIYRAAEEFGR